jgi:hypothetical protein
LSVITSTSFLDWLLDAIVAEQADALLIAGMCTTTPIRRRRRRSSCTVSCGWPRSAHRI